MADNAHPSCCGRRAAAAAMPTIIAWLMGLQIALS